MDRYRTPVVITLIAILIVGSLGIRLISAIGVPPILIYISYIALVIYLIMIPLAIKGSDIGFIMNILLALVIMVSNTVTRAHMSILLSFDPFYNATVILTGAYLLQSVLLITSLKALRVNRSAD